MKFVKIHTKFQNFIQKIPPKIILQPTDQIGMERKQSWWEQAHRNRCCFEGPGAVKLLRVKSTSHKEGENLISGRKI